MAEPRTQLAARGGRLRAAEYESCQALFDGAAKVYDALARKLSRIAERVTISAASRQLRLKMPSLHDFLHPIVWGQALLFGFPTYLGAKAFAGRERHVYLTLTAAVTVFSMFLGAMAQHDSDQELAARASQRVVLQTKIGQLQQTVSHLSGDGAFPVIESGLTTQTVGRLMMENLTKAPLTGVMVEYSCSYVDSPMSYTENVGTIPPNSSVYLTTLLPLENCRSFTPTSPTTPPMAAWQISMTTQNGQFFESLLFRRGPGCPMWDWNAQVDQLPGFGYLKNGKLGEVGQDKLLWHTPGWVNQKCNARSRY